MLHLKVEVLEREEPPRHLGVCVLRSGHPLEGCVVRNEGEPPAQEVVAQLQDRPLDGQSFLLHGGVVLFGRGQLSADVQDGMLFTFLNLGQNGSQSGVGGIRLQQKGAAEVGGSQNWLRGERHLHPSQGLLCLGCPTHLLWLPLPGQVCQGGG